MFTNQVSFELNDIDDPQLRMVSEFTTDNPSLNSNSVTANGANGVILNCEITPGAFSGTFIITYTDSILVETLVSKSLSIIQVAALTTSTLNNSLNILLNNVCESTLANPFTVDSQAIGITAINSLTADPCKTVEIVANYYALIQLGLTYTYDQYYIIVRDNVLDLKIITLVRIWHFNTSIRSLVFLNM